ncbi:hypothetical protein BDR04DRAFT_1090609 [Suillus decipiens]|nr:hypothetical protein BDR04DRAFT_1090609 [Suillus decipiens]
MHRMEIRSVLIIHAVSSCSLPSLSTCCAIRHPSLASNHMHSSFFISVEFSASCLVIGLTRSSTVLIQNIDTNA